VGRLKDYLGKPSFYYDPSDFALLADDPAEEAYTKKTCLWGDFIAPLPLIVGQLTSVEPVLGSKMHFFTPITG